MTKSQQTPMMQQYNELKERYPDAILFFRLGDFYEMFNEDAIEVSKILEITLTSRNKNAENPIPMCGVPHHSAQQYIRTLVDEGYKVAICEQMEDPKLTKGMVKRDVVRIITPGTVTETESLSSKENNFILSYIQNQGDFYIAYADVSTGESYLTQSDDQSQILSEIQTIHPKEIIVQKDYPLKVHQLLKQNSPAIISEHDMVGDYSHLWPQLQLNTCQTQVLNLLFSYVQSVQMQALDYFQDVTLYQLHDYLHMNYYTKQQLELTQSLRTQRKKGSLLWYLDRTKTAMGGRLLRQWLEKPLYHKQDLLDRHMKVETLIHHYFERIDLSQSMMEVYDLERLITRVSQGTANVRDLVHLKVSLANIPMMNAILKQINHQSGQEVFDLFDDFSALYQKIDQTLVADPPISATEGGIINKGVSETLDHYLDALENGNQWLQELQQREREKTGLKTLKVGFNKVFGYYIEISRLQAQSLTDDRYVRKQTLTNAERFITDELKDIEQTILQAQEKSKQLEYEIFVELRQVIKSYQEDLQNLAHQIAALDVLATFAEITEKENFVRADLSDEVYDYEIIGGFHPVVSQLIGASEFVANDLNISPDKHLLLLTGPNMSGKSTYMRQIAYIVILNQIGCFVPATRACLPLVDKIFTRIGSSDDISQGQSTFMVEMMETNVALRQATQRSLLLFDELGRGTATYDGMALAQGIIEYIHDKVKAVTIFSTHYHELTALETQLGKLKNIHVGATEQDGRLIFLHKIIEGPADKSYGIHVAKLAALPESLIENAQEVLKELENQDAHTKETPKTHLAISPDSSDTHLRNQNHPIIKELQDLSINNLTPMQALNLLETWQNSLQS